MGVWAVGQVSGVVRVGLSCGLPGPAQRLTTAGDGSQQTGDLQGNLGAA